MSLICTVIADQAANPAAQQRQVLPREQMAGAEVHSTCRHATQLVRMVAAALNMDTAAAHLTIAWLAMDVKTAALPHHRRPL